MVSKKPVPAKAATDPEGKEAVDEFLRKLDHPLKPAVEALRRIILSADPGIREGIKWNSPSFRFGEYFATANLRPEGPVRVVFHRGAKAKDGGADMRIADPSGLIEWHAEDRCSATFRDAREVESKEASLRDIVRQWIRLFGGARESGARPPSSCGELSDPIRHEETPMSPPKNTQKSATATGRKSEGFTAEERAAMKERAEELKAAARRGPGADKEEGESEVLAKIAEMPEPERAMGKRLHALIKATAPALSPRTWYGMPAWAKDGKVVCFFQSAQKFKTRYSSFGFNDAANLDEGAMWPVSFALKELTAAEEARIAALVRKAVS